MQPTETARALLAATFADALRGWVVGDSGTVLRTVDGGQSWISQETPTKEDLRGVVFVGTELGWAAGRAGTILHTSDGGQTWEVQDPGTTADLYGIHFADAHAGWVVGEGGTVRRTTDGGRTWQAQGVETRASLVGGPSGRGGGLGGGQWWHGIAECGWRQDMVGSTAVPVVSGAGLLPGRGSGGVAGVDRALSFEGSR
ncbi:MAG: YCF48-related protein [Verrucomicrobia bacterium]|nr:YCF48-related protein [Verrucomicrobiota bacterium]